MKSTQKLAIATLGTALSLSLLNVDSAQAAIVTYDIVGSNPSGSFSFDDSNIGLVPITPDLFFTGLTSFNFQIDNETYTLSNVRSFGGRFDQAGVYFDGIRNPNGVFEPSLSPVSLSAYATLNNTSVLITAIQPSLGFVVDDSYYQFFINSQPVSSGVIAYTQQVPEPDFAAGDAAGLGIVALGWLKKKGTRVRAIILTKVTSRAQG